MNKKQIVITVVIAVCALFVGYFIGDRAATYKINSNISANAAINNQIGDSTSNSQGANETKTTEVSTEVSQTQSITSITESKPAETKPIETKAAETKVAETKPTETVAQTKVVAQETTKPAETEAPKQETQPQQETPTINSYYKAGMYKVGKDIPAGEYVIISYSGYMQVSKDSTGSFNSIICNDNIENRTIITVKEGQYLELTEGKIYPIDIAPKVEAKDGKLPAGMYKVGLDIQPGEYKISSYINGYGYNEVAKDSSHSFESIITNDNFQGTKYITIKTGQYLKLNNASLLLK